MAKSDATYVFDGHRLPGDGFVNVYSRLGPKYKCIYGALWPSREKADQVGEGVAYRLHITLKPGAKP